MTDIYFRTDGNSKIATGHIMRCLTIARACVRQGGTVKFIVSDEESLALLRERFEIPQEFDTCCLNSNYGNLSSELPALLSSLTTDSKAIGTVSDVKPWIFIDSYYATTSYFMALRKHFRVAYLDDLRSIDCSVDLLINYDTEEDCDCYANASRKLLGAQYTPLREQFHAPSYTVRPEARHVLLSTGGTDPYRVAESLLHNIYDQTLPTRILSERQAGELSKSCASSTHQNMQNCLPDANETASLRSMHYHILTSRANTRYDALNALAQAHPSIHIHTDVTYVAALMASCDLAVSAGGTTLCELCAVGVPSISYLMAENQRTAIEAYAKRNLIPCAGDIRPTVSAQNSDSCIHHTNTGSTSLSITENPDSYVPDTSTLRHILDFLSVMAQKYDARTAVSSSMRSFMDGTGAELIAQALLG